MTMQDKSRILLKGGRLYTNGHSFVSDILVSDGKISRIAPDIQEDDTVTVVDVSGKAVSCGLVDVHVHFREPGFSDKETIASGGAAAARGGYTLVCTMPNLNPAPDALDTLGVQLDLIKAQATVDVLPFATITSRREGGSVVDMAALKPYVAGFSDDGSGVQSAEVMREAMKLAKANDVVISAHCEDMDEPPFSASSEYKQVERDVAMAAEIGCRYHVCHVSTKESVEAVRRAKASGASVSCETGPHYLTLTQADRVDLTDPAASPADGGRFRMNPPLREASDRDALLAGIIDGTVEVIATDHAPHTAEQKSRGYDRSAMGIVGLETAFPVLYTKLVMTGIISLEKLFTLMCDNPRGIFRFGGALAEGEKADIAVFDVDSEYIIDSSTFASMGHSTPFDGWKVRGHCILTIKDGKVVYSE